MDAILFSANPRRVQVKDAIDHLINHGELYWEVGFSIKRKEFSFPIFGYIHICGNQVKYIATIKDIIPFSPSHYEDEILSREIKPAVWIREWKYNINSCKYYPWKNALIITKIESFSFNTYQIEKFKGGPVRHPPQGYIRVLPPTITNQSFISEKVNDDIFHKQFVYEKPSLAERNLEDFVITQLQKIEPELILIDRQLVTQAGRLDILCRDKEGWYVVIELKKYLGTDQVVGQILKYIGWVQDFYKTNKVRGIIIVGKKDIALSYAVKAVQNIQVKEFKLSIE